MQKVLKKKITTLIVMCSMILMVVAFPVAVSAANLTFDPGNDGVIGQQDEGRPYTCTTVSGHIKPDDVALVFGASRAGYRLKLWKITNQSSITTSTSSQEFADENSLLNYTFDDASQYTLEAEWEKAIDLLFYNVGPTDENTSLNMSLSNGFSITEEWVHANFPDRYGYTVIGLEYAGKGGNDGDVYEYGTPISQDTELRLRWKKVAVPGGGGGSADDTPTRPDPSGGGGGGGPRGGGGGAPNPKTGDLGIAPYVGIVTISALGTAGVVKLLKKEK